MENTNTERQNEMERNRFQTKEQDKTPEEQLSKVELGNLSEKEFRVMIVKLIDNLEKEWRNKQRRYKKCLPKG